jgi:hypothetical protein
MTTSPKFRSLFRRFRRLRRRFRCLRRKSRRLRRRSRRPRRRSRSVLRKSRIYSAAVRCFCPVRDNILVANGIDKKCASRRDEMLVILGINWEFYRIYSAAVLFFTLNPARGVKCITGGEAKRNRRIGTPPTPKALQGRDS